MSSMLPVDAGQWVMSGSGARTRVDKQRDGDTMTRDDDLQ
jgi:hypothetical protein